ncbi:MAG: molybdopterin-binding protein, partial [Desulfovibrionaceae bacterium]
MIKTVPVQEAVGMVLCHDMTRILPGESKGPAFRKGHIISEQDIPELLSIGKEHIYVL